MLIITFRSYHYAFICAKQIDACSIIQVKGYTGMYSQADSVSRLCQWTQCREDDVCGGEL
jgi:hypothetical protein